MYKNENCYKSSYYKHYKTFDHKINSMNKNYYILHTENKIRKKENYLKKKIPVMEPRNTNNLSSVYNNNVWGRISFKICPVNMVIGWNTYLVNQL